MDFCPYEKEDEHGADVCGSFKKSIANDAWCAQCGHFESCHKKIDKVAEATARLVAAQNELADAEEAYLAACAEAVTLAAKERLLDHHVKWKTLLERLGGE